MAELQEPIEGMVDLNRFEQNGDGADGYLDADFGPLEMFDSNSAEPPMSSLAEAAEAEQKEKAPTALMSAAEPPSSASKKSKRDKKSKKKKGSEELGEAAGSKRSKRHASTLDASPTNGAQTLDGPSSPSQSKRKRDASDGADGPGGRKRHRSKDNTAAETEAEVELGDSTVEAQVAAQLHQDNHDNVEEQDPVTTGQEITLDSEDLAREALNEYMSGRNRADAANDEGNEEVNDVDMDDVQPPVQDHSGVYGDPQSPEPQPQPSDLTSPRPKRSARTKKAKPTFFEQPPAPEYDEDYDGNNDAYGELPSPSAGTPKPRRRAKPAARKPKAQRLSKSMRGGSDEDDDADARVRRNRMEGFTQGRFTDDEIERIGNVVSDFRENHGLSQHQVNEMIHAPGGTAAGDAHAQLWAALFAECPDRHRQKVINITRKKFHNFVARGTWTPEQEHELRQLIDVHGTRWSKIAALINRHPEDIRDRYRNYIICGDSQRKDLWDEEEEMKLTRHVMEAMQLLDEVRSMHPRRELLGKSYEELIDWQDISHRMERTRSRLQCITKWRSMNLQISGKSHLASLEPGSGVSFQLDRARQQIKVMPEEERFRLLLAIKSSSAASESKIPWQKLVDKLYRNEWHRSTQALLWHRMKKHVPDWERKTVRDCAQYLLDEYNQTNKLPEVDGDDFDDAEEMHVIQTTATNAGGGGGGGGSGKAEGKTRGKRRAAKSSEIIEPSADDNGESWLQDQDGEAKDEAVPEPEAEVEAGLQIDPALTEQPAQPEETATEAAARAALEAEMDIAPEAVAETLLEKTLEPESIPELQKSARKSGKKGSRGKKRAAPGTETGPASSDAEDVADIPAKV